MIHFAILVILLLYFCTTSVKFVPCFFLFIHFYNVAFFKTVYSRFAVIAASSCIKFVFSR